TSRRPDHPVCGGSVASRLFIDAAATPPLQGGEYVDQIPYNPTIKMSIIVSILLVFLIMARISAAQAPGALFQSRCVSCHAAGNGVGAPLPETLRQMSWQAVLAALETGKMKPVGDDLSATEREAIAKSLGTAVLNPMSPSAKCSAAPQRASATGNWNGWADAANTRFQPARQAGLTRQTTPKLKLKWAFGFPGVTTAFGVASVVDGRVFVGAA